MTAAITGRSAQITQQYARSAQAAANDSARSATDAPAKARVRTRTFGFQLGSFGLTYTAEDVQLEPAPKPPSAARSGFDQSLETASLRREMVGSAASETLSRIPPQRRNGLRAYQNALSPAATQTNRNLLAVA